MRHSEFPFREAIPQLAPPTIIVAGDGGDGNGRRGGISTGAAITAAAGAAVFLWLLAA
mgnify:FL=1